MELSRCRWYLKAGGPPGKGHCSNRQDRAGALQPPRAASFSALSCMTRGTGAGQEAGKLFPTTHLSLSMKYLGGISVPLLGFPGPALTQLRGTHFGLLPRPAFPSLPPHPSQQPILRSLFLPKLPKAPLISSFFVFPTTHWLGPIQGPRPPDPPSPPTGCTQWMETVHQGRLHLQPQQGLELSAIPLPSPRRRSFTHAPGPLTTTYSGTTNPLLQEVTSASIPLKADQR